ncbi:hypothetical protein SCLCIDRAFT_1213708 [Scleroderma citrinum Foug A]|uniref:Chorismate mutase domain-containing protein n=1 Tax=Scleroderma citrinum Foug A TaxID=1036808 RepID=A0A0C3DTG0_9AGAM|nr:hypothetical protein SCLCIDRAFT_1213708 [Scleroderma citrinum Foug A]
MFSAHYLFATLHLWIAVARGSSTSDSCYYIPLPDLPVSKDNRTVPWGEPTIKYSDGTTCCSSLDQIRNELDAIDSQLLQLLSIRAAYVGEATRFKPTESSVNVPSRNQEVNQGAIDGAPAVHLPQVVAKMVFESIVNSSILFEECIFNAYDYDMDLCSD